MEAANQNEKYILCVDHGTSGVKSAIISVYGKVIAYEFQETPLILGKDEEEGAAEQDANLWWDAFLKTAAKLIAKNVVPKEQIEAVCVSGQWGCTVAVDEQGLPLHNAISWLDTRGAPYIHDLVRGKFINIEGYGLLNLLRWIPKTGGGPTLAGKDPIAHMLFIKNELPEVYAKTHKLLDSKDYMNLRLTGKFAASYDSIHLTWLTNSRDLQNIHYEDGLIKQMGIDKAKLPDLIKSTDVLGYLTEDVAKAIGLSDNVKVMGGCGDLQMAAIGSGAVRDYEGHIYIGTSAFVICHVPFKKTDLFHSIASLPSGNPDKYFVATEQDTAGGCLNFLRDKILFSDLDDETKATIGYDMLDDIAVKVPAGSNKLIFTPWLYGERTPIEDHTVRGGFHNLSLNNDLNDMVRAVFEGVAFNSRWVLQYVEKFIGRKMETLNIIGGGANSNIWCQIYADILNRNIRKVKDPIQGNARGCAFVASVGLGYMTFEDIPEHMEYDKTFTPQAENRELYDSLFKEFVMIYKKNRKIYKRLNG